MKWLVDSPDYEIRYTNKEDHAHLLEWISPPEVRRWYPISTEKDAEEIAKNWIGFHRFAASLTAVYQGEPVGIATLFLMPYRKLAHHSLAYLIVNPNFSKRGIGTSLVRNVAHLGETYFHFEKVTAELYEGCPAMPIFLKEGFEEVLRQDHFVKEGEESYLARIILEKQFTK